MTTADSLHKLAELIRVGCQFTEKNVGSYFLGDDGSDEFYPGGLDGGKITHACVLGAAYLGCYGGKVEGTVYSNDIDPSIAGHANALQLEVYGPAELLAFEPGKQALATWMIYLNDDYGWSRERIADWIEALAEATVVSSGLAKEAQANESRTT